MPSAPLRFAYGGPYQLAIPTSDEIGLPCGVGWGAVGRAGSVLRALSREAAELRGVPYTGVGGGGGE
ncbi:MAG: hypothetical protein NVSMB62_18760 [Acidobacteriaceae bacterium]